MSKYCKTRSTVHHVALYCHRSHIKSCRSSVSANFLIRLNLWPNADLMIETHESVSGGHV